jgi:nucleotide-binding universal stress UspA family protein
MEPRVGKVLVGIDGSDDARRALEWAMSTARAFGAELLVVHAAGLLTHLGKGPAVPSQSHLRELRRTFEDDWCAPLAASDLSHRTLVLEGPPVLALLEAAESEGADLIVVGRHGAGGVAGVFGSTSHDLAEHSHRPVIIVPPLA